MAARRLVLIRHAKSLQHGPLARTDVLRPLNDRGEREAPMIGLHLLAEGIAVDRVVISPARRTRQTWDLAAAELSDPPAPVLDERIYENGVEGLLEVARASPAYVGTLILVGHNPSISMLASSAAATGNITHDAAEGAADHPAVARGGGSTRGDIVSLATGSVAVCGVGVSWAEITQRTLWLESVWSPPA